ncbi:aminotransferase class I/II-fold pyridoxal phosphate-dependent enzyme [Candidatus Pelagibacter bacterium]|jgi:CDP-4-dehydro-6-deoxyglucose reductase, E1|nr:aminotransferase class I/II-fold pyridoxal phosphate-dependent enzyme [Candidatus Pelagibacter bacterium]MDA8841466.1 aminotransferase class I/II-fold pyridoxal phosphate-dependent enzyme [Candidatus Pelagibacter bacterium]
MDNNFTKSDMDSVIKLVKKKNIILTQSKNVKEFEKKWSKWVGTKYSVFVNSGSSANFITISALKTLNKNKNKNEIIVPTLTWVSDINSVIMNGFKPVFVDINLSNLSMNTDQVIKKISKKTLAVFITHAQGFNGLDDKLVSTLKKKKIHLIEDVCESHGATYNKKKLGSYGLISNFSFYYAHHLTTIEGGMACTNDKKIYETLKMLRSHGMIRESGNKQYEKKTLKKNKDLSPKFIFLHPTLNFRNNEIGAVIGINQLKSLDKNNNQRAKNFKLFLDLLDGKKYFKSFNLEGNSNYAFPIILQTKDLKIRDYFEKKLKIANIEFRRGNAGGGNQLRQPYIKNIVKNVNLNNFKNVEHVHFFGYYIGNYPSLKSKKIIKITNFLNRLDL